jgi:AraC-like DNA-binding protein
MLTQSGGCLTQPKELFIEKFVSLVEENMSDNELSVEKLAGMLNISQKMLYRRVKNATGLSAKALVRKIRLRNAAILLSKYDRTVAEVAYKVGYNDPSYFTKSFGTEFKKTPLQFQREAKSTAAGDK